MRHPITESFMFAFRWTVILVLAVAVFGCGVTINMTHYYTINGDDNRISGTVRTDSRPDITTSTNATATIPASVLP